MKDFVAHNYQQYCIDRIINDPAIGLFLDMGLGKTAITLSAIKKLKYEYWRVCKVLIVAPKKVAEYMEQRGGKVESAKKPPFLVRAWLSRKTHKSTQYFG